MFQIKDLTGSNSTTVPVDNFGVANTNNLLSGNSTNDNRNATAIIDSVPKPKPMNKKTINFAEDWESQMKFAKLCEWKECPECPAQEYYCKTDSNECELMPEVTCHKDALVYMVEIVPSAVCPDPDASNGSGTGSEDGKKSFDGRKIMAKHKECTKSMIANNAKEVTEKINALRAIMERNEKAFEDQIAENQKSIREKFKKYLGALKEGFTPLTLNLVPGKGTDSDGNLIEGRCYTHN